ncbi:MAG: anthranilate synthase component I [Firmicutes bacterium HGW-Firmicutes-21]|nr:MAG: anthranilate synthase component I [Firmicutes bacterium HGW-Firmicutes-21]
MFFPSFERASELVATEQYRCIPISCEINSDIKTPIEVLRILKNISRHCYMLESIEDTKNWGRYTFLGFDPKMELTYLNGNLRIKNGGEINEYTSNPAEHIRRIINEHKSPRIEGLPPFTGGLVGYFSYDFIKYAEPSLRLDAVDNECFNDVDLMLFDKVIAFDNFRQKIILIINIRTDSLTAEYNRAITELRQLIELIKYGTPARIKPLKLKSEFKPFFNKEQYCDMVEKGKGHIFEGDVFQLVLSNRLEADFEGSLFDVYRILRTTNPSPYMFYFSSDDIEIAGASPETLVKLNNGRLYTFPLAGTRPRGRTPEEDIQNEKDLLSDEKEFAEHNMLVDLGRNDIGRISEIGTVKVEKYMSVERFSHVMHIGSTVTGQIREDKDAMDAISAVLPAGTLSGAPKIRACEIINALEKNKRGIYGGAIGYLDFTGNMDTCIAIRIAYAKGGKLFIRSGAGIVADSVAENEYNECISKARAVVSAVYKAQEGID